jgi:hypothetical protein
MKEGKTGISELQLDTDPQGGNELGLPDGDAAATTASQEEPPGYCEAGAGDTATHTDHEELEAIGKVTKRFKSNKKQTQSSALAVLCSAALE